MKTKKIISSVILAGIMTLQTSSTFAQGQGDTNGGGVGLKEKNGQMALSDLKDPTICRWKKGPSFLKSLNSSSRKELSRVLDKFSETNWYFSHYLGAEIENITYCLTTKLNKVNTTDNDSVTKPFLLDSNKNQIAIRDIPNKIVYLDSMFFAQMNSTHQVFTMIHEALHSFIKIDVDQRNNKLRSMTDSGRHAQDGPRTHHQQS